METILFFQRTDTYAARLRLEGLSAFARSVGWHVQVYAERFDRDALRDIFDFWQPVGTVLGVAVTCIGAYPLSRKEFQGRSVFMRIIMVTM